MIGSKTPFRISFIGGGSDLREFYRRQPGHVLSTTINQHMFVFIHPFWDERIQVKYSRTERVRRIEDIQHPIVRETLRRFALRGIDINSIADIPAGTGLGSSGAFTVGLLNALYAYCGQNPKSEALAKEACEIEIDILKEPIGKQDQYAAAFGGFNFFTFHADDSVTVEPLKVTEAKLREFENNLLFFYLGGSRPARDILAGQKHQTATDQKTFLKIKRMTELAQYLKTSLLEGSLRDVGAILEENWFLKKALSPRISSDKIDYFYDVARRNGATGGKLLGAGGTGFLMFYCEQDNQEKLKSALKDLREYKFRFDKEGTKVIFIN